MVRALVPACVVLALIATPAGADDETSTGDKLRILYARRVLFGDDGDPLVTVEIAGGQSRIELSAPGGLVALPDGDGGAEVRAGQRWTITAERATPAAVREWTVVRRLPPDRDREARAELGRWKARGLAARTFEVGSLFAVGGEVIDSRVTLVAVDPVAAGRGADRARALGAKYRLPVEVHRELARRPSGTIVARSGETVVRNPSVVWFAPAERDRTIEVADVPTGGGGSSPAVGRQHRRYFGRVYVAVGADGKLTAVNAISAERLLTGLVPSEMFPSAPAQALQAQAVAARTELLQKIGTRHLDDPFLLCSTQHCQVYAGAGHEDPRTTAAVAATRGQVLLRPGGGLIDARYSADCGGHGEDNDFVWGGDPDPALRGRRDDPAAPESGTVGGTAGATAGAGRRSTGEIEASLDREQDGSWCGASSRAPGRHRWDVTVSSAELDRLVADAALSVGHVVALEPLERGVSGRIGRLRVRGDRGAAVVHGDLAIRRALGGLRSSLFVVRALGPADRPSAFELRGAGFGHGVGLCQLGAIGMAEKGKSYRQILGHYYRGSRLHRLY